MQQFSVTIIAERCYTHKLSIEVPAAMIAATINQGQFSVTINYLALRYVHYIHIKRPLLHDYEPHALVLGNNLSRIESRKLEKKRPVKLVHPT